MRPSTRLTFRRLPQGFGCPSHVRPIHSTVAKAANVAPVLGTGPPPAPPAPTERTVNDRVERRKRQAEMLKTAKIIRNAKDGKTTTLQRRFWKDVTIQDVNGERYRLRDCANKGGSILHEAVANMLTRRLASSSRLETTSTPSYKGDYPTSGLEAQPGGRPRPRVGCLDVCATSHETASHTSDRTRLPSH